MNLRKEEKREEKKNQQVKKNVALRTYTVSAGFQNMFGCSSFQIMLIYNHSFIQNLDRCLIAYWATLFQSAFYSPGNWTKKTYLQSLNSINS